jgi:hypothetical protein
VAYVTVSKAVVEIGCQSFVVALLDVLHNLLRHRRLLHVLQDSSCCVVFSPCSSSAKKQKPSGSFQNQFGFTETVSVLAAGHKSRAPTVCSPEASNGREQTKAVEERKRVMYGPRGQASTFTKGRRAWPR